MNNLERFLRNRNADADTWVDAEGLHVHDWRARLGNRSVLIIRCERKRFSLHLHLYPCNANIVRFRCMLSRNLNL